MLAYRWRRGQATPLAAVLAAVALLLGACAGGPPEPLPGSPDADVGGAAPPTSAPTDPTVVTRGAEERPVTILGTGGALLGRIGDDFDPPPFDYRPGRACRAALAGAYGPPIPHCEVVQGPRGPVVGLVLEADGRLDVYVSCPAGDRAVHRPWLEQQTAADLDDVRFRPVVGDGWEALLVEHRAGREVGFELLHPGPRCPEVAAVLPGGVLATARVADGAVLVEVPDLVEGAAAPTSTWHCVRRDAEGAWVSVAYPGWASPPNCAGVRRAR